MSWIARLSFSNVKFRYLAQEATLLLIGSYWLFLGATLNGLALLPLFQVTVFLLSGISLVWLGWHIQRRQKLWASFIIYPLAGLLITYLVSDLASAAPRRGLTLVWLFAWAVWVYVLVSDLLQHGWPRELFIKVLLILGGVVISFTIGNLVVWQLRWLEVAGGVPPLWPRLAPFFSHANYLAAFINLVWPLAVMGWVESRSRLGRLWYGLFIIGSGITLLFSSSRGGLVAAGSAGLCLAAYYLFQKNSWLHFQMGRPIGWWQWGVTGMSMIVIGAGVWKVAQKLVAHPSHDGGSLLTLRSYYWRVAWQAFQTSPILGTGPNTYADAFIRQLSIPPGHLYVHAHGFLMHLLAETGVVGAGMALWFGGAVVSALWHRWRGALADERRYLIGGIAALLTLAVHGIIDTPTVIPAITLVGVMLLALILTPERGEAQPALAHRGVSGGASVLSVGLVTLGVWLSWTYAPYDQAMSRVYQKDYEAALPLFETALHRDPQLAYYQFQAGFVSGLAAETHPELRSQAIAHYQAGLALEPGYSVNSANLAVLLWQQGKREEALQTLAQAAKLAPQSAIYALNLGVFYEEQNRPDEAQAAYRQALNLSPIWGQAWFWRSSDLRRQTFLVWQKSQPTSAQAKELLPDVELAQAEETLRAQPANPTAYLRQGQAWLALKQWPEAEISLRKALLCIEAGGSDIEAVNQIEFKYTLAQAIYAQGRQAEAIGTLAQVLQLEREQTFWGMGSSDDPLTYGWALYNRIGLINDALPGLVIIRVTDNDAPKWLMLGHWYEAEGQWNDARDLYEFVLHEIPDSLEAASRLATLPKP
jgi:tetratricopeptide (TPR) repeat protein